MIGATKVIGSPPVKSAKISVPGSDVTLDFTEAFGGVHYENREIVLTFVSVQPWSAQMAQDSSVKNALHGRKMNVTFSDDPNYYWVGRVSVGDWTYHKGGGIVEVTIDAEPYKYKSEETVKSKSGDGDITLTNSRMPVVPYVSSTKSATLAWTGNSVSISAGNNQLIPQLVLEQGNTVVTVTTEGKVTFKYREGSL